MAASTQSMSVKRRLTRVILTACLGVLGFTCIALFIFEVRSYRSETARNLAMAANIIAENSAGVLLFDDQKTASEILGGLRAEPGITVAALFDKKGKLYATYPKQISRELFPQNIGNDGIELKMFELTVQLPVMQDAARVGTIYLKGNLVGTYQRLSAYGVVILGVGACSIMVALLLSSIVQRRIADPLVSLAGTARTVTNEKDYSVRAVKFEADEFGELTDAFNSMLDQIEHSSTALRAGEERFRTLADNMAQLAWMTDADGSITWYNKRWFDYTGTTMEEMKDSGRLKVHDPAHAERVINKFKAAIQAGMDWEDVFPLRGKDGKFRWFLSRAFPIRNETGRIVRWFGTNTDITEQRLAQETLKSHAQRAEILSKAATELFLAESPQASLKSILPRIAGILEAEFYFYYTVVASENQLLLQSAGGLTPVQLGDCKKIKFGEGLCGSCALEGAPLVIENVMNSSLETAISARALGIRAYACYPLRSGSRMLGTLAFATTTRDRYSAAELQFIHTVSDVISASIERERLASELRQARDVAERANAAKDGFLAALSHELRTPLNPVLLIASESATDATLPPAVRENFATIAKNVNVESQLIDDLLDLTKISRGKLNLEMRLVDAHDILRDAIDLINSDLAEKMITLKVELEPGQHPFMGDPVRIQQVFWNVLKNAIKFSPEKSQISVLSKTASGENRLGIEIADHGIGLTPEELPRIFEAFEQGDHAADRGAHRFGGLGLGLAISRTLIELHGGSLSAKSPGRGLGATFVIQVPLSRTKTDSIRVDTTDNPETKTLPRIRILLVEDHAPTRTALRLLLDRRGHHVVVASTVAEARKLATETTFDLVVSDIGLPDESGYVLMADLRDKFGLKGIALSGYGTASDIAMGQQAGFVAHLTKPVNIQALDATLASVLRSSSI